MQKNSDEIKKVLRIVDVNLNRCREGLRIAEDWLRFISDDAILYKKVRQIRHNTDKVLREFYDNLIVERDSFCDSGRTMPEAEKKDVSGIVIANLKRAQESLRVLEEYSKTFCLRACAEFKKQRYAAYDIEKEIFLKYKKFLVLKDNNNDIND